MLTKIATYNSENRKFSINEIKLNELKPTEVLIKQTAIAINEIDVIDSKNIANLGYAACGEVESIGEAVDWLKSGDRVAYVADINSYCSHKILDNSKLIKVPSNINSNAAAGILYRGCVAHMAAVRAFIVKPGMNILVDGIHSATSTFIAWMAKKCGAFVIGIAPENISVTSEICNVIVKNDQDLIKNILNATENIGCHGYFSSLITIPIEKIIEALTVSGVIVDHIGSIGSINMNQLMCKSLFITAPSMMDYKTIKSELILSATEVWGMMINEKSLQMTYSEYPFDKIENAFAEVADAKSSSIVILKP